MTGLRSFADPDQIFADADVRDARQMAEWLAPDAGRTFYPGEPIARPRGRRPDASMARALLVVGLLSGVGWALFKTEALWRPLVTPLLEQAAGEISGVYARLTVAPEPVKPRAAEVSPPASDVTALQTARDVGDTPGAQAGEAMQQAAPANSSGEAPATEASDGPEDGMAPPAAPLPPPQADPADPYQGRALAAGLHPKISRVLLARLTEEDYRNARAAIAKALAEVADDGKLEWPKQRAPGRALFTVHFVPGAAAECRRYVVSVTKDRWTTTALPMERCGVEVPKARRTSLQE